MPLLLLRSRLFLILLAGASTGFAASQVGRRFPPEKTTYADPVTHLRITALTTDPANDAKIYQTHPQWSADGQWIIFRSNRGAVETPAAAMPGTDSATKAGGTYQAFAVNEGSGDIVQLTDGSAGFSGMINVARKSMKIYFLRYSAPDAPAQMIELDIGRLLADSARHSVQASGDYERVCGVLPAGMRDSGGFGLDADETAAYIGVRGGDCGTHLPPGTPIVATQTGQRMGAGPAGLRRMDLRTGAVTVIIDTPFLMGHVQTNPWVPGEIVYCHETGGDAPQRMWSVRADGTDNRPLYVETPAEWITHEAVISADELVFNIMGHLPKLREKPTGIAVLNLRNNQMKLYGQVEDQPPGARGTGGFWHSNGSPDGRWLVGDTFAGNLWLIDRRTGAQTLLSTDHKMKPDHTHPTFSPDSTRILIQSGHLSDGTSLDLMIVPVPESLRRSN